MSVIKERMVDIIDRQPEDSTYEEILRELAFEKMIDRGLQDSRGNRTVSNEAMREEIQSWSK